MGRPPLHDVDFGGITIAELDRMPAAWRAVARCLGEGKGVDDIARASAVGVDTVVSTRARIKRMVLELRGLVEPKLTLRRPAPKTADEDHGELRPVDLVPCPKCHLRGHVAGDPVRCLGVRSAADLAGSRPRNGWEACP